MVRVPEVTRRIVERRAQGRCEYCHAPRRGGNARFHVERFVPRSRGGTDDLDNLNLSCVTCNLAKGSAIDALDPARGGRVPLFNPRVQRWDEHFAWESDGVTLRGETAIGAATVVALNMNQPLQQDARVGWRQLGLLP